MAAKKLAPDLSGLVATKGQAAPVANIPQRSAAPDRARGEQCSTEFPCVRRLA